MSVEANIAALTGAVTGLTQAVNVSKSTLDIAVSAAAASAAQSGADRIQTAADKAAAAQAAAQAATSAGAAGSGPATALAYPAAAKNLVTAANVVGVCLYDTSRDSDGGAWRERCRASSWYQEALNTSTRGGRRSFPALALLVVRAGAVAANNTLTIYDCHDLDAAGVARMWMVFAGGLAFKGWTPFGSVFALNGRIYRTADAGTTGDLWVTDLVADLHYFHGAGGRAIPSNPRVSDRNTAGTSQVVSGPGIVADRCLAVHAAVLPGAPLDSAGLPIPTLAVATAGGTSVIHPSGAVYDITRATGHNVVSWRPDGRLAIGYAGADNALIIGPAPYADIAENAWGEYRTTSGGLPRRMASAMTALAPNAVGGDKGLELYAWDDGHRSNSAVAYVTTAFSSGWQPGDIRAALLCDSATGSIAGTGEMIVNGDLAADTTGWSAGGSGALSQVGGRLRVTSTAAASSFASQTFTTLPGRAYTVSVDAATGPAAYWYVDVIDAGAGTVLASATGTTSGAGRFFTFVAAGVTTRVRLFAPSVAAGYTDYDNISVRAALPDRSYKGRGLVVNGTLSQTALPCGLAAIGGYTGANFLTQQYNADLNYAADFWVRFWLSTTTAAAGIVCREGGAGARWAVLLSGGAVDFRTSADGSTWPAALVGPAVADGRWHCVDCVRRGALFEVWVDGQLGGAGTRALHDLTNTGATLWVGVTPQLANALDGQLVLLRTAAYAPAPAQLRRMYEDERALVVGGQQALLGGVSNIVTALAADPDTGVLEVAGPDGVSSMVRLARVAYRDTATSAPAIASDSIVAIASASGMTAVATAANAGLLSPPYLARDGLPAAPRPLVPARAPSPTAVTTDATPTDLSLRLWVGAGETRTIRSIVTGRQYGQAATEVASYVVQATVKRDYGGNVMLVGTATVTVIQETTAAMDCAVSLDVSAQTYTERVTGLAGTRIVWVAERTVVGITSGENYAA